MWKCFIILKLKICISFVGKKIFKETKKKGDVLLKKNSSAGLWYNECKCCFKKNVNYFWLELKVELNSSSFFFLFSRSCGNHFWVFSYIIACINAFGKQNKKHFLTFDNFINDILRPNQQKLKWKKQQHHYKNLLHS